jgi:hypothetical protein
MNAKKPVQQPEQGRFFLFWLILYLYIICLSYIVGIVGKPLDKRKNVANTADKEKLLIWGCFGGW